VQGEQVLGNGQTLSSGTFSCTAEASPGSYQIE
jgi:hypothetical protein